MKQLERLNLLKNEIPQLKDEIITRSKNTVKGVTHVIVTEELVVTVLDQNQTNAKQLISFSSGPIGEKGFAAELEEAIRRETQYVDVND